MGVFNMSATGGGNLSYRYLPGFVSGGQLAWASNTTATVAACYCRDSTDAVNIVTAAVTLNMAVNGLNGLDTGTFAASKVYYVYAIADSMGNNTSGVIASLSSSGPTLLPVGYDCYRRIGQVFSDSSVHLLLFYQFGNSNMRKYQWDTVINALTAGASATLVALDLSASVPVLDGLPVLFKCSYTPATASNIFSVIPGTSTATAVMGGSGVVAAQVQVSELEVISKLVSSLPKVKYLVGNASDALTLNVAGYTDMI